MSQPSHAARHPLRVAIAGFGNVGSSVARRLAAGDIPEACLTALCDADTEKARIGGAGFDPPPHVVPLAELPGYADVVVECATFEAFPDIARTVLEAGTPLLALSVGALAENLDLIDLARRQGVYIRVASGTLAGLDAVRAAAEGTIAEVTLSERAPPATLADEAVVRDQGLDLCQPLAAPVRVFHGTARQAAAAFPRHFNIAATLSLAGLGLDETQVEVWADPAVDGAVEHVEVRSGDVDLTLESRNRPSPNKNTSRIVALSVLAALRSMVAPIRLGS